MLAKTRNLNFTDRMTERYSRQILFREIGKAGQQKLLGSRVLLIGCGALGASHAEMLSRAGSESQNRRPRFCRVYKPATTNALSTRAMPRPTAKSGCRKKRIAEMNSDVEVEEIVC